jgi:hypothetical protein
MAWQHAQEQKGFCVYIRRRRRVCEYKQRNNNSWNLIRSRSFFSLRSRYFIILFASIVRC